MVRRIMILENEALYSHLFFRRLAFNRSRPKVTFYPIFQYHFTRDSNGEDDDLILCGYDIMPETVAELVIVLQVVLPVWLC